MRTVQVLSGEQEAHFAALGVVAGIPRFHRHRRRSRRRQPRTLVDLPQGTTPWARRTNSASSACRTIPAARSARRARLARERLAKSEPAQGQAGRPVLRHRRHLAVARQDAPGAARLSAAHGPALRRPRPATSAKLCDEIVDAAAAGKPIPGAEHVSSSRRDLVPYGAAVLGEVLRAGKFDSVLFSALGVREGYLYGLLLARGASDRSAAAGRRGDLDPALALAGACRRSDRFHRRAS